jgi:hypothetical protein
VYTCREYCGRTLPTNQALGGHAAGHRSRQGEAAAVGTVRELGEDGAAAFLLAAPAAGSRRRRPRRTYECRKCRKVFATRVALGGHMRVHYTSPPIVPARRNKKKRCLAMQPVEEDIAAAAAADADPAPPSDLSLALSIKTEEATPPAAAPAGGVRAAVRLFGIDISL